MHVGIWGFGETKGQHSISCLVSAFEFMTFKACICSYAHTHATAYTCARVHVQMRARVRVRAQHVTMFQNSFYVCDYVSKYVLLMSLCCKTRRTYVTMFRNTFYLCYYVSKYCLLMVLCFKIRVTYVTIQVLRTSRRAIGDRPNLNLRSVRLARA